MEDKVKKAVQFLSNPKTSFTSLDKKYEFLRSKLTPSEFEEARKRYEESKDFSKYFEPASNTEQQASTSWNLKIVKTVGAVLFGAVTLGYYFSRNPSEDTNLTQIKELLDDKFSQQTENIEGLRKQISEIRFELESLKRTQEDMKDVIDKWQAPKEEEKKIESQVKISELYEKCFAGISESNKGLALKTMKMWFSNLVANPYDKTKSRINVTNPHYKNYFAGSAAANELFEYVGFVGNGSFLEFGLQDLTRINLVLEKITEGINSLPSVQFSPAAPWQIAKSIEKKQEDVVVEEAKVEERPLINTENS